MRKTIFCSALMMFVVAASLAVPAAAAENPRVAIETSKGRIVVELDEEKAPATVASFVETVESGFYTGTIFHRVIKGFMVQGGGFSSDGQLKPTDKQLQNEADNGLKNVRGTVAMARKGDPHSASVQFYINDADNSFLDHKAPSPRGWGYCVFGRVVEGMDVVDAIAAVSVRRTGLSEAQPLENVLIKSATVLESAAASADG